LARERPVPPKPDLLRRPEGAFGWLDARLLHDHWLDRLGPDATALLAFLALAADRHGASFYGRERMAAILGLARLALDRALNRLLELSLVAHRPWHSGHPDGVWQLLPVPRLSPRERKAEPAPLRDLLGDLGLTPPPDSRGSPSPDRQNPADSRRR
jgi:hypothetical protein